MESTPSPSTVYYSRMSRANESPFRCEIWNRNRHCLYAKLVFERELTLIADNDFGSEREGWSQRSTTADNKFHRVFMSLRIILRVFDAVFGWNKYRERMWKLINVPCGQRIVWLNRDWNLSSWDCSFGERFQLLGQTPLTTIGNLSPLLPFSYRLTEVCPLGHVSVHILSGPSIDLYSFA